jgi:hypothetical protein
MGKVGRMGFLTNLFGIECPNCHVKSPIGQASTIDVIDAKKRTEGSWLKLNRRLFTETTYMHRVCEHTWTVTSTPS